MKKLLLVLMLLLSVNLLAACDSINKDDIPDDILDRVIEDPNDIYSRPLQSCDGYSDFVVIDGVCLPMEDILSEYITINGSETRASFNNSIQLMTDFVADLSGSTGLAILSRDVYEGQVAEEEVPLSGEEPEDEPENLIVKLTEDGFFEAVSFSDDNGFNVNILSNPLALEVYGEFTVVIFEVDFGYDDPNIDFNGKVWNSFYGGGIYLIHNETGKMFATKDVVFTENQWTEYEYHQRTLNLTVTLNEPVVEVTQKLIVDEFGMPVLDEFGVEQFEEVITQLEDPNGNPIIFSVGPLQTEVLEIPVVDYYEQQVTIEETVPVFEWEPVFDENGDQLFDAVGNPVYEETNIQVLDENGDPVFETIQVPQFDEFNNPIIEIIEVPVLDENGDPKIDFMEVPVVDENGDPVYEETFDVEFVIDEQIEIIHITSEATIQDNALTILAEKFIQKVMEEYYNWNYYRVNDYVIDDYSFTYNNSYIYYVEWEQSNSGNSQERIIKRVYFDDVAQEIVIENYIDITLAGFEDCSIYVDPVNSTIICDPWNQENIKVYTELYGLATIPDTENLQPISLPNGELYFYDPQSEFIEELGYYTTTLLNLNADGTMNSSYIELAEYNEICNWENCDSWVEVDYYDELGNLMENMYNNNIHVSHAIGEAFIQSADIYFDSIGEFSSVRDECTEVEGCWYNKTIEIVDSEGTTLYLLNSGGQYYPGGTIPGFLDQYLLDENAIIEYAKEQSSVIETCTFDIGCYNNVYIVDNSMNQYGLYIWDNQLINENEDLIQSIIINDENEAVYEYTRTNTSEVCDAGPCSAWVEIRFLDEGQVLFTNWDNVTVEDGELIPLRVDKEISDDSLVELYEFPCGTANCVEEILVDNMSFWLSYEHGEDMYMSIDFAETDVTLVTEFTEYSLQCTDQYGCYNEGVYEVVDELGNVVYSFANGFQVDYAETAPFKVTVSIDDVTINYQTEYSQVNKVCDDTVCDEYINIFIGTPEDNEHVGSKNALYAQGETIIQSIFIPEANFLLTQDNQTCTNLDGCTFDTSNYTILDELGNVLSESDPDYYNWVPYTFAYGEDIPTDNNFPVTYVMQNIEYRTQRISVHDFMWRLNEMERLDDNLYFIERDQWSQGEHNFLLSFNEVTQRYNVSYTNISAVEEITKYDDTYIGINSDKTAIIQFSFNAELSDENLKFYDEVDLTEGLSINGVNDIIVNYDGSVYFKGVDNFLNLITGYIDEFNEVHIDTEYTEPVIVRVRPIN